MALAFIRGGRLPFPHGLVADWRLPGLVVVGFAETIVKALGVLNPETNCPGSIRKAPIYWSRPFLIAVTTGRSTRQVDNPIKQPGCSGPVSRLCHRGLDSHEVRVSLTW